MSHERIEREARTIATMLDRGDAQGATERLREDLRNCGAQEFHAIVNRAYKLEDPNRGANLVKEQLFYGSARQNDFGRSRQDDNTFVLKVVAGRSYDDWDRNRWDHRDRDRYWDDRSRSREFTIAEMGIGVRASQGPILRERLPGYITADLMDRGDIRTAAAAIRTEAEYGSAQRFQTILSQIYNYERPGVGADLIFRRQQQYSWRNDGTDRIQVELQMSDRDRHYNDRGWYDRDRYGSRDRVQVAEITYWAKPRHVRYDDRNPYYDDRRYPLR